MIGATSEVGSLPKNLSLPSVLVRVWVVKSLIFCVVYNTHFFFYLFLLVIVLSLVLRVTVMITLLAYPNIFYDYYIVFIKFTRKGMGMLLIKSPELQSPMLASEAKVSSTQ
jgi:hypothetical protein